MQRNAAFGLRHRSIQTNHLAMIDVVGPPSWQSFSHSGLSSDCRPFSGCLPNLSCRSYSADRMVISGGRYGIGSADHGNQLGNNTVQFFGLGSFHSRIQRQQIGLESDLIDGFDDFECFLTRFGKSAASGLGRIGRAAANIFTKNRSFFIDPVPSARVS